VNARKRAIAEGKLKGKITYTYYANIINIYFGE